MKTMKTNMLMVVSVMLAGCGTDVDGSYAQQESKVGPTRCAPGEVLWTFGATSQGTHTSQYDSFSPNAKFTPRTYNRVEEVLEFKCRQNNDFLAADRSSIIAADCVGSPDCRVDPGCNTPEAIYNPEIFGPKEVLAKWRCTDQAPGYYYYYEHANPLVTRLYCPQTPLTPPAGNPRTVCVPERCYGPSRRDANLACEADFTRGTYNESELRLGELDLRPKYRPFHTTQRNWPNPKRLDYGQRYHFSTVLSYFNSVPTEARAVLWLTERWQSPQGDAIDVFRCQAHLFDVGKAVAGNTATARVEGDIELSPDCFNGAIATEQRDIAASKAGIGVQQLLQYKKLGVQVHVSWDMEAKNVFVPKGVTAATACAPNPLDFFYVKRGGTMVDLGYYDFMSYLEQQELRYPFRRPRDFDPANPKLDSTWSGFFFGRDDVESDRIELGISDFRVDEPAITIRVNSSRTFQLPTAMEFYVANDTRHTYDLYPNLRPRVTAYLVPRSADGGYQPPTDDLGFEAVGTVYMPQPEARSDGGAPTVGPLGVTVAGLYVFSQPLKQKFITPNSKLSIDNGSRTFEVLACVDAADDVGLPNSTQTRFWRPNPRFDVGSARIVSIGNNEDAEKAFTPPGFPNPGRGCRWSKTPVVITIDKSVGAVEPISARPWDGEVKGDDTGNGSDNQSSDNDNDRTCMVNSVDRPKCNTASRNTQRGDGQFGRTYYSTSSAGVADPGTGNPGMSANDDSSASASGEMLGFQVLDPASEEETEQWELDSVNQQQKVTMTITPPWDNIWQALRQAQNGNSNPEWSKGRYSGFLGLGVGWGFKIPLNQFGMVTITFSVGFSIALTLEVKYSLKPDDSYLCLNKSAPCLQVNSDNLSFADAVKECGKRGARLAELSSSTESAALSTLLTGQNLDTFWVGAQLNNEYSPAGCLYSWNAGLCMPKHKTTFRWLSNDQTFATAIGNTNGTIDTSKIFFSGGVSNTGLIPKVPQKAGITLKKDGSIAATALAEGHPSVCVYDPATKDFPITTTAAVKAAVGIGVGIEWCWPNDEAGLCLSGALNFASASITPQVVYSMHLLKDSMGRHAKRDNVQLTAEFALTMLEGSVEAKVKAWLFEWSYTILEFSGYRVQKMTLYDFNYPSIEAFR